jgi:hypothetical protein
MDKRISVEQMLALGAEIAGPIASPATLIEKAQELLKVRDREGNVRMLTANAAQHAFETARGQRNIILKARQMGMTTWVSGRFFLKTVTHRGMLTVQVAHTREAAESIFRIVQRFWEGLPEPYRLGALKKSRSNVRQMVFKELDSEFRVISAADRNAGRGLTIQNLHCSEVSRWPGDAGETLMGLRAALSPQGEMVLESTPNGAYGCFYTEWNQAEETGTVKHFFPWWLERSYKSEPAEHPNMEERDLMQRHGLSLEQIGYRRQLASRYRTLRSQEFAEDAESCFRATGDCYFQVDPIERRLRGLGEPPERRENGALWMFRRPIQGQRYILGMDPAGGHPDGDYGAIQVIERDTGEQCAEFQGRVNPTELSKIAARLSAEYNEAIVVVERNNHGHAAIAYIQQQTRATLWRDEKGEPGWLNTVASKPQAIVRLAELLDRKTELFWSKRLLAECRTFVTRQNGSTGAVAGAHDDCVMAMAIALEARAAVVPHSRTLENGTVCF